MRRKRPKRARHTASRFGPRLRRIKNKLSGVMAPAAVGAGLGLAILLGVLAARLWLPLEPSRPTLALAANGPDRAAPRAAADKARTFAPAASRAASGKGEAVRREAISSAAADQPAWLRFAAAAPETRGRPMIAVVIDDLGTDKARSAAAIALPSAVTLAFLPYAADVAAQAESARAAGHELLVHVPMEPQNGAANPGPNALLTGLSDDEILARLRWNLARMNGYVGINNHMGSRFTRDARAMALVMAELKERGLLFLDSRTAAEEVGAGLAARFGVPFARRQVFLDNNESAGGVRAQLADVERIAREGGHAIAIGHPHEATLAALREWLPRLEGEGFVLVPLSAVVRRTRAAASARGAG